ncbi:MAG: multicopper oxidase family protein [Burkholderiaceae bacterium]
MNHPDTASYAPHRPSAGRRNALKMAGGLGVTLAGGACSVGGTLSAPMAGSSTAGAAVQTLVSAPASVRLVPDSRGPTPVWSYGGTVPGTRLDVRQGAAIAIDFRNELPDPSTIHWHGIRLPNAMDGVPYLTQPPVDPGGRFRYAFAPPDAGTYWYHPHLGTPEQVGRGLYGALIVHEADPPAVDRDLLWLIDDWRLDGNAAIVEDFYNWSDVAFDGRIGNTVTVNGMEHHAEPVRRGERIRLRLVNTANARMVSLAFGEHPVWLMALDGHPLPRPQRVTSDQDVFLGPGQRADLIIDMTGPAGESFAVMDRLYRHRAYPVATLEYGQAGALRPTTVLAARGAPAPLVPNELPEPALADARRVRIVMDGGMMRGPHVPWTTRAARRLRRLAGERIADPAWSLNGRAHLGHGPDHPFEFVADQGETVHIAFENRSTKWHPMHLHGHAFRELTRNGRPVPMQPWHDTTMVAPGETLEVAFVADNPGDWLIHCHILEHHAGGMGTQFRVAA